MKFMNCSHKEFAGNITEGDVFVSPNPRRDTYSLYHYQPVPGYAGRHLYQVFKAILWDDEYNRLFNNDGTVNELNFDSVTKENSWYFGITFELLSGENHQRIIREAFEVENDLDRPCRFKNPEFFPVGTEVLICYRNRYSVKFSVNKRPWENTDSYFVLKTTTKPVRNDSESYVLTGNAYIDGVSCPSTSIASENGKDIYNLTFVAAVLKRGGGTNGFIISKGQYKEKLTTAPKRKRFSPTAKSQSKAEYVDYISNTPSYRRHGVHRYFYVNKFIAENSRNIDATIYDEMCDTFCKIFGGNKWPPTRTQRQKYIHWIRQNENRYIFPKNQCINVDDIVGSCDNDELLHHYQDPYDGEEQLNVFLDLWSMRTLYDHVVYHLTRRDSGYHMLSMSSFRRLVKTPKQLYKHTIHVGGKDFSFISLFATTTVSAEICQKFNSELRELMRYAEDPNVVEKYNKHMLIDSVTSVERGNDTIDINAKFNLADLLCTIDHAVHYGLLAVTEKKVHSDDDETTGAVDWYD